jgi:serine/threonine protein phosphatase PrpC
MRVAVRGATDIGRARSVNEDAHAWWIPPEAAETRRRGVLLVVADGMGGAQAGELASRLAVEAVVEFFRQGQDPDPLLDLRDAVGSANARVHRKSLSRAEWAGMGTTCTALVILGTDLLLAHVGDSRAYLARPGVITRLTDDHSLVAELVRDGRLTQEEARTHPRRNVVTRAVGVGAEVEIDAFRYDGALETGDSILLCSDGLHGVLSDPEILDVVEKEDREQVCARLIDLANERGGPDNITVLLAWLEEG